MRFVAISLLHTITVLLCCTLSATASAAATEVTTAPQTTTPSPNSGLVVQSIISNRQFSYDTTDPAAYDCVDDAHHPEKILRNASLYYREKYWWYAARGKLTVCPYVNVPYFTATQYFSYDFAFGNSQSSLWATANATESAIQCGIVCDVIPPNDSNNSQVVDRTSYTFQGNPRTTFQQTTNNTSTFNATSGSLVNMTTEVIATFSTVSCFVSSSGIRNSSELEFEEAQSGFDDGVCTAFIQYNSSYWENGTVFATPRNLTAVVVEDVILSGGLITNIVIEFPHLSSCPWYLINTLNTSDWEYVSTSNAPIITLYVTPLFGGDVRGILMTNFLLQNLSCDASSGSAVFRAQIGSSQGDYALDQFTSVASQTFSLIDVTHLSLVYWNSVMPLTTTILLAPGVTVQVLPPFDPNVSSWTPFVNYSSPAWSRNSTRCYHVLPLSTNGTPTTLGYGILCSIKNRMYIFTHLLNVTAFCCDARADSNSFVWSNYVQVELYRPGLDAGNVVWFVDTSGITPTMMTPAPATSSPGGTNNSDGSNNTNATPTPGGVGRDDSSSSGGSGGGGTANVGAILGGTLSGVVVIVAAIVAYFYCVWKPRQDAIENEYAKNAASGATFTPLHLREMTVGLLREEESGIDQAGSPAATGNSILMGIYNVSLDEDNVIL
ncbi:membrane-associated protein, putative [Bodo saltans]|uniref:Membrane-associated protein, putative n=1 Tax=Bodo saltans TaxID=75058 RepID=A0A0S4J5H5_BODSA|nr:membrane-associated protein, putative [Bodo saltans]|eukprot:CUG85232.1 membrane-associated protein, putative [Bodo saltans]